MSAASSDEDKGAVSAALAEGDPAIDALSSTARLAAANAWQWRADSERTAADVFARITEGLRDDGALEDVLALADAAVDEERGHARLAHLVACRYAGKSLLEPAPRNIAPPQFGTADARTNRLLFLVLHCCINETIAAAYLRACLQEARGATARAAVRTFLADEIRHARIGWAHLGSTYVTGADRAHVEGALPVLLRLARAAWSAPIPGTSGLEAGHGCLTESLEATVKEAIDAVVLAGFAHVGIRAIVDPA